MKKHNADLPAQRRDFLGKIAAGIAALSFTSFVSPFKANAELNPLTDDDLPEDPDAWFNKIKGKHRIVFDVTEPYEVYPFAWPRVFLKTNAATGSPSKDCGVVVVLRHAAIPYAFKDELWTKYKFGEMFKANDPATKEASVRNPFWKPKKGDFVVPGLGEVAIGINELQDSGVMFCVCDAAITVYSAVAAQGMGMAAADVKKEWLASLLPKIKVVPSGVWALGRAQEHGCGYIAVQ
ncbi:MAG: twin-arginine translocation signal domain-containing protein [Bacteroidota bacterium]